MTPALLPRSLIRRDDNHGCISRGRAGDHILQELLMPGRVNDREPALVCPKMDLGSINGDVLLLLLHESIEDKGVFETAAIPLTRGPNRLELSFGKGVSRFEDTANHRRLSVVDMPDEDNLHMNPFARSFCMACGSWWSWARPARSLERVVSSSAMISSMVAALLAMGCVIGWHPNER